MRLNSELPFVITTAHAAAGRHQVVSPGEVFALDGGFSENVQSFQWEQVAGPPASVTTGQDAVLSATAPETEAGEDALIRYELTVTDEMGGQDTDSVEILVTRKRSAVYIDGHPANRLTGDQPYSANESDGLFS